MVHNMKSHTWHWDEMADMVFQEQGVRMCGFFQRPWEGFLISLLFGNVPSGFFGGELKFLRLWRCNAHSSSVIGRVECEDGSCDTAQSLSYNCAHITFVQQCSGDIPEFCLKNIRGVRMFCLVPEVVLVFEGPRFHPSWKLCGPGVSLIWDLSRKFGSRDSLTEWKHLSWYSCAQDQSEVPVWTSCVCILLRLAFCCWACPECLVIMTSIIILNVRQIHMEIVWCGEDIVWVDSVSCGLRRIEWTKSHDKTH